ncbi:unnamed protein product [Schistosoma bovis]|nr:unnamed protein product [Schistosoma bovis]
MLLVSPSLFSVIPILETTNITSHNSDTLPLSVSEFEKRLLTCIKDVESQFSNTIYHQFYDAVVGITLVPIMEDIFIGFFLNKAFKQAIKQSNEYSKCVSDAFIIISMQFTN